MESMSKSEDIMEIKFETINNLQINNEYNSVYSISFECIMVNEVLNKKYKVKCCSRKSILDAKYKKTTKKTDKFSTHESHLYLDFTNLVNTNGEEVTFEILEELN